MSTFPVNEAQLVALFMQSVAYGAHVATFGACLSALLARLHDRSRTPINWPIFVAAVLLFTIGTMDVSFNLYHNLQAFIFYSGAGGSEEDFQRLGDWVNVMRVSLG